MAARGFCPACKQPIEALNEHKHCKTAFDYGWNQALKEVNERLEAMKK